LDFSDVSEYKFNKSCTQNGLISKAIIYGKNSIGKSNLGLALFDIVSTLTDKNVTPNLYDYYLTAGNVNNYAEFHYVFSFGSDTVDYVYRKKSLKELVYERVELNGRELYECSLGGIKIKGLAEFAPTLNSVPDLKSISYLKYVVNNVPLDENNPLKKLVKFVSQMLWFRSLDENRYIGYTSNSSDYYTFITEQETVSEFQDLLHKAGLEDDLTVIKDADGEKRLYIKTEPPLPFFKVASNGTKALYNLFYWLKTAPEASFIFIDEFDAFYHFELAETIVEMLENLTDIQILLTSHNTNLLSNKIMRPDCYFILTKDKITSLKNATDRDLREGHNLEKLYMSGEFGGI
jgi:hypothetical protein